MIGLDRTGQPPFPCDTVPNTRCESFRERMLSHYCDLILEKNGVFPYTAPKVRWCQQNHSTTYRQIGSLVMPRGSGGDGR
jgi:sugar (pentulose or hexulose) kinase